MNKPDIANDFRHLQPINPEALQSNVNFQVGPKQKLEHETFLHVLSHVVEKVGKRIAIRDHSESATYNDVWQAAQNGAQYLLAQGIGPGTLVGIALDRSEEYVTSILSVWLAGGAFFPIAPDTPSKRLSSMLAQTGASHLIARSETTVTGLGSLEAKATPAVIPTELLFKWVAKEFGQTPKIRGSDLAYVIFTSGSTGLPKGAMVRHDGLLNHLHCKIDLLALTKDDLVGLSAPIMFDISIWQMFAALSVGGAITIFDEEEVHDPEKYFGKVIEEGVTIAQIVPSFLRVACSADWFGTNSGGIGKLRYLLVTGEALPVDVSRTWVRNFPSIPLINAYGPTECSDDVAHFVVDRDPPADAFSMPIGEAIRNTGLYVLKSVGDDWHFVEDGGAGELWVTGVAVGAGYLNDPERSADAFYQNGIDADSSLAYRTGDLVRLRDGVFEYLGRVDRQIKIRGFRIELGEVEEALRKLPKVHDAVVKGISRGRRRVYGLQEESNQHAAFSDANHQSLGAYVIADSHTRRDELVTGLSDILPDYMIPDHIVFVSDFPLNSNGKIDLKALPDPQSDDLSEALTQNEPETEYERELAEIWQGILGLDRIDVETGYPDYGGDSLAAVQITNAISSAFGVRIGYRQFRSHPTIRQQAKMIENLVADSSVKPTVVTPTDTVSTREAFVANDAQKGLWFLWKLEPDNPYYTFQGSIFIDGALGDGVLERAVDTVLARHPILTSRFQMRDGQLWCVPDRTEQPEVQNKDISHLSANAQRAEIRHYAAEQVDAVFDLEADMLMRLCAFRLSESETVLVLTTHEIVMDAWSARNLVEELEIACGNSDAAPSWYIQTAIYGAQELQPSSVMEKARKYWHDRLSNLPPPLVLFTDRIRRQAPKFHGASVDLRLDQATSNRVRSVLRSRDVSLFELVMAAYFVVLHLRSGTSDIVIGAPFANRTSQEDEHRIGYFLNMLPLRVQISANDTLLDILNHVSSAVADGIEHADFPFISMVEELEIGRDRNATPVFQVMFDMLNIPGRENNGGRPEMSFREIEKGYYKYDLNLYCYEEADEIFLKLAYQKDVFDHSTVGLILEQIVDFIRHLTDRPESLVSTLPALRPAEENVRKKALIGPAIAVESKPLIAIFDEVCATVGHRTALLFEGAALSFAALQTTTQAIAAGLQEAGMQPGDIVALRFEAEQNTIPAILGVLRAGGKYCVLDPQYPEDWARETVSANGIRWAISDMQSDALDGVQMITPGVAEAYVPDKAAWTQGGCLIRTSGSTGDAKIVCLSQAMILGRVASGWTAYPLTEQDVMLSYRSASLVMHIPELFMGLLHGMTTVWLPRTSVASPHRFVAMLERTRVSVMHGSPVMAEAIITEITARPARNALKHLRLFLCGSEEVRDDLPDRWQKSIPKARLVHTYGQTETASTVASYDTGELKSHHIKVPIGRAMPGLELDVIDENGNSVPINAPGLLTVRGSYFDHDVPVNTGDLVRIRQPGVLEYAGRNDLQVNILGNRFSLVELENALNACAYVNESCAVLRERDDTPTIVAFFVLSDGEITNSERTTMSELSGRVPSYMLPQRIVEVDSLPRLPNGKIDRQSITTAPIPNSAKLEISELPEIKRSVSRIWANVLQSETPDGINDFFSSGGSSFKAVQLIHEINSEFGTDLTVRTLFEGKSTVSHLSDEIAAQMESA